MSSIIARCTAALVGAALVVVPLAPANAATPEQETADWMVSQLDDGLAPPGTGNNALGLTADVVIALDVLGEDAAAADVATSLAGQAEAYATLEGEEGSVFAGEAGKLAVASRAAGQDARSYGGLDLVELVETAVTAPDSPVGAARDTYSFDGVTYTDPVNTIKQMWASRALLEAGSDLAGDALAQVLRQVCPTGDVRLTPEEAPCSATPDTVSHDTTAFVLDYLVRARDAGITPTAREASVPTLAQGVDRTAARLESVQGVDGSLSDLGAANSNTTGLAAAALAAAGRDEAAGSAARWISSLRLTSGPDSGGIGYDETAFDVAVAGGISEGLRDQWLRATAQAALALPLADVTPRITVDTGAGRFAAPGTEAEVRVTGLQPDEAFTVSGGQDDVTGTVGNDGSATAGVTLSDRVGEVTLTLTGSAPERTATATVEVLAPADFTVTAPERVAPGEPIDVEVDGARDGEPLTTRVVPADRADETPSDESDDAPVGTLAAEQGLTAPDEPGEYVVLVASAVPDRAGASDAVTVAATAGTGDEDSGDAAGGAAGGGGELVPIDSAALPNAGSSLSPVSLWAALASLLAGSGLVAGARGRQGAHR